MNLLIAIAALFTASIDTNMYLRCDGLPCTMKETKIEQLVENYETQYANQYGCVTVTRRTIYNHPISKMLGWADETRVQIATEEGKTLGVFWINHHRNIRI